MELRGPYIGGGGRFDAAGDKDDGEPPPCSVRASWRRRELADERGDKLALFPGAGGEPGWLGRRWPEQGCRAAVAASPWLAGDAARLCLARCGEGEHAACEGTRRAGCGRSRAGVSAGRDAAARAPLVQYARSGRVQCTHGRCSTQCRGMLQVTGEVGKQQN